MIVRMKKIKE